MFYVKANKTGFSAIRELFRLEQVYVRGLNRRGLRLESIAGLGMALALAPAVGATGPATTSTTLSAQSSTQNCPTSTASSQLTTALTTLTVTVTGSGAVPSGTVNIEDEASGSPVQVASATLNASGQATVSLYLADGSHTLLAVYAGDSTYSTSTSMPASASISSQCTALFVVSLSNILPSASSSSSGMTLATGQSGTATVTVTPSQEYVASLSTTGSPAFVTVSCSGLPSLASCTFAPESLEILPGQDAGAITSMLIQTQGEGTAQAWPSTRPGPGRSDRGVWAIVLPGMLGIGGLAWGRGGRRRWLQRLTLVALVGLVTTLGTAACNPLYYYYHHGPPKTPATPSGTFNVTVTGQSSNGVTSISNTTTLVLTVQ